MPAIDISNIRSTIIPKSDQMNFEDLIAGPRTITITDVRPGSEEQPLIICYEGDGGHPYKPSKTFRKVLAYGWGEDARQWIGRSLTLFGDPSIKWAGVAVGGIAISHMSHIPEPIEIKLSQTRGKRVAHSVAVLEATPPPPSLTTVLHAISKAKDKASMQEAKTLAMELVNEGDVEQAQKAYAARVQELKGSTTAA